MEIILIIKILLIAFVYTRFEPLHSWAANIIKNSKSVLKSLVANLLHNNMTTCIKCLAFWVGLIMSHNFYIAAIAMILAFIYDKKFSSWERQNRLQ